MKFILILMLYGSVATTAEFNSKAACEAAIEQVKAIKANSMGICVPKGNVP